MKFLKKVVKKMFYRYYHICPKNTQDLQYECDGRIVRSLAEDNKKYCAAYLLNGMRK